MQNNDTPLLTISAAANILEVSIPTLRMYEREGLIIPFKKESNQRLYSNNDIDRLKCIRNAINEQKISINGIRTIYSLIPCWEITNCPIDQREKCSAYINSGKPCWTYDHAEDACSGKNCRECPVYKDFADCHKIKDSIIQIGHRNS